MATTDSKFGSVQFHDASLTTAITSTQTAVTNAIQSSNLTGTQKAALTAAQTLLVSQAQSLMNQLLTSKSGSAIKTAAGVFGVIYTVVEQVSQLPANQGKLTGSVKMELAINIATMIVNGLYNSSPPLITSDVYQKANLVIADSTLLTDAIEGAVELAQASGLLSTIKADVIKAAAATKSCFSCC